MTDGDGMEFRNAAGKLFDSAAFEDAKLSQFVVTARPEVLDLLARAMRIAAEETLRDEVGDPGLIMPEHIAKVVAARIESRISQK